MKCLARWAWVALVCGGLAFAQQAAGAGSGKGKAAVAEPTVVATPAMWRVTGPHGTAYLFGSIHVMKPNVDWETPKVKAALAGSGVVYLEVANLDDAAAVQPLAMQYGLDKEHPLSTKISKEDVALLDAAAKGMGLPGEQVFEPMQPWLVSASLQVLPMLKAGFAPSSGIDTKLLAETKGQQKPVRGFETMADQIHMLADVPQAEQAELLHKELTELDKSAAQMQELVAAWERGDVETIGKIDHEELAAKYPAEYKRMVVDRNTKWAATLDGLLKSPDAGTAFVIVGAAHLAGPDSVIKMLEKDGYTVERE